MRDPNLPEMLVRRLTGDADIRVRRAIAAHARLPEDVHVRLLASSDVAAAVAAAANPVLPVARMREVVEGAGL